MKTTIEIADSLLIRAKELAAARRTTLRAIVEEALRDSFERARQASESTGEPEPAEMRVFVGRGLQPGLAWDDLTAAIDVSYEGRGG